MNGIKTPIIIMVAVFSVNILPAQVLDKNHNNDSIISYQNLASDEARQAWFAMNDAWLTCCFYKCLKQHNIKMNCAQCEKVFLTVVLKIDSNG
ncbi:MAG TPA: hypothetical protein PLL90_06970, partial [Bacteroidales bacterium]|nr:hypothetical protein [Bacteroidales bacterium]